MRKIVMLMACCIGISVSASAQDWISITGRVAKVHQGKEATFYTVIAQDGVEYIANSARASVGQNESVFKKAYDDKTWLHIEFQSHEKHPGSIWNIRRIEPAVEPDKKNQVELLG
jgi:hypothetical protein